MKKNKIKINKDFLIFMTGKRKEKQQTALKFQQSTVDDDQAIG